MSDSIVILDLQTSHVHQYTPVFQVIESLEFEHSDSNSDFIYKH